MKISPELVRAEAAKLAEASPEAILRWACRTFAPRIALTSSFSGPGIVLVHMVAQVAPETPVYFLDTGFHFPETLAFKNEFARRFGIHLVDLRAELTPEQQAELYGDDLYQRDPDLCCQLRKVEPMMQALEGLDAWVTGLRRDQSQTRAAIDVLEYHETPSGHPLVKVMPLARWTRKEVWSYILEHQIPYHPMLDLGYKSIGCAPCTCPVAEGAAERDGRWAGTGKTECGLHTMTRRRA